MSTKFASVTPASPGTIEFLKNTFSSSDTFIGELMANSRRANATEIHFRCDPEVMPLTLHISDDGDGITDLAALLNIFSSGWNNKTTKKEHPFGMGFYASLFACSSVYVRSAFGEMLGDSDVLYSAQEVVYEDETPLDKGTEIVLEDILGSIGAEGIQDAIYAFAKGFPTPVYHNGARVPNPHAVTNDFLKWVTDEESGIVMEDCYRVPNRKTAYFQGLPIQRDWLDRFSYGGGVTIAVHLDDVEGLKPRMPDRQSFLNPDDAKSVVNAACDLFLTKRLIEVIERDPKEASEYFGEIFRLGLMPLLTRHKYMHKSALFVATSQTSSVIDEVLNSWHTDCVIGQDKILPPMSTNPQVVSLISTQFNIPYAREAYAMHKDAEWTTSKIWLKLEGKVSKFTVDNYNVLVADIILVHDGVEKRLDTPVGYAEQYYIPVNCLQGLMHMGGAHIDIAYDFDEEDTYEGGYLEQLMIRIQQKAIETQIDDVTELVRASITDLNSRAYGASYIVNVGETGTVTVQEHPNE